VSRGLVFSPPNTEDTGGDAMNWQQIEGKWDQMKGKVREKWGKFTDSDLEMIAGKKDQMVGRLKERYGLEKEAAERELDSWIKSVD
jgi:uncharacterized protein YjbJ (UPF0337 family)